jgi:hypothetical protein
MSGVLLRCPNCGTTKATPGECEACHEADVRYFCTNHTPGHWLDAPMCPDCGARFGQKSLPAPSRRPAAPMPARPTARDSKRPAGSSAGTRSTGHWEEAKLRRRPEDDGIPSFDDEPKELRRKAEIRDVVLSRFPELDRRLRRSSPERDPVDIADAARAGLAVGRFLVRAVLFGLFLLIMLFFGALILGGSLLQGTGIYVF